jgi:dihydrofolate reductase
MAGDAVEETKKLKQFDGKNIVIWGSLSLAKALIKENLVDEYHLQICPAIIGGGRLLFPNLEVFQNLKLMSTKRYNTGVVYLQYEPV